MWVLTATMISHMEEMSGARSRSSHTAVLLNFKKANDPANWSFLEEITRMICLF